jgi:hypothetical protein
MNIGRVAVDQAERRREVPAKSAQELKARRVNDILIGVVDGLKGFPEPITSVFPQTVVQDLHRAPDPQQLSFRVLEGEKGDPARDQGDLPG